MKSQKRAAAKAVTARTHSLRDDAIDDTIEEGLSTDPEQMGQSFLRYATESGTAGRDVLPELRADGEPAGDAALHGSHFSSDGSIWENTAGLVMESGGIDDLASEAVPPDPDDDAEDGRSERGVAEVDLTASVIEEASLLDEESSVLGETVPRPARTDDTGPKGRTQDDDDA